MDSFVNEENDQESDKVPVNIKIMDLEVPQNHPQVDGKINNVTFKTDRPDEWKSAILSYFGESRSCSIKDGSVIKVSFDFKGRNRG